MMPVAVNSNESGMQGIADKIERGRRMKVLGNTTALLIALSIMGGLILAQRSYQNSWREPTAIQTSATTAGTPVPDGEYKVVMK